MQLKQAEEAQVIQQNPNNEDLSRVLLKLARFLFKKNLLDEFKKEHSGEKQIINNFEYQIQKPIQKKKPKKNKKQPKDEEEDISKIIQEPVEIEPQEIDKRWKAWVKNIQEFVKNEYYLYENLYYKLKSATSTLFQYNFKLDVVNTRNNRKQELIITKNKRIYWISTTKIQLQCSQNRYFAQFPSQQKLYVENPVYLQAIKKYWSKAAFYAVVPTTLQKQPCLEIIMIQFDY